MKEIFSTFPAMVLPAVVLVYEGSQYTDSPHRIPRFNLILITKRLSDRSLAVTQFQNLIDELVSLVDFQVVGTTTLFKALEDKTLRIDNGGTSAAEIAITAEDY